MPRTHPLNDVVMLSETETSLICFRENRFRKRSEILRFAQNDIIRWLAVCPPLNARSIFSADCWCVAFIGLLRWDWKTCPQADFYFCPTTSHGLTLSCCNSLARAQFVTSSTRSIMINRFYTCFCARWVVFQSIFGIRVPPFAPRLKKSL